MLQRLLIFIYFILLFAGTFTEQIEPFDKQLNINAVSHDEQQVRSSYLSTQPIFIEQKSYVARLASVQLAASEECMADIQKYCAGGGGYKMISNLKVLQCVDDLDNVSFSRQEKLDFFLVLP